jgi:predicted N-acetyltransferase YhbS
VFPIKEKTLVTEAHEPADIKERFFRKQFFIIVASHEDKIIGAVRYKFLPKNFLYLYKLAVLKTYRKGGVGAALVRETEKAARKKKCKKILLDCAREKKLPAYYKKFGFRIDKVKKHLDHYDVYMSKRI